MYRPNKLKEYIKETKLIKYSENFSIRLDETLYENYKNGLYNEELESLNSIMKMIENLNITYPGMAKPILYLYIVPMNSYKELLQIPDAFDNGKGGGKPVACIDIDGFVQALGYSENMLKGKTIVSCYINNIHEVAHLVNSMFACKNRFIHEGFADALPFFAFDMENEFKEHLDMILNLKESDIYTVDELITAENSCEYDKHWIEPAINCSFVKGYVSSYLFTRVCLEAICEKYNVSPTESINIYLNMLRTSMCTSHYLIYDIALELGLDKDKLCNTKDYQLELIIKMKNQYKNIGLSK